MKKEKPCMCKTCGKSTFADNKCLYQDERMAFCPTFIKMKPKKTKEK